MAPFHVNILFDFTIYIYIFGSAERQTVNTGPHKSVLQWEREKRETTLEKFIRGTCIKFISTR